MSKETATAAVRLFPSTRKKLNVRAAKESKSLAQVVEDLTKTL